MRLLDYGPAAKERARALLRKVWSRPGLPTAVQIHITVHTSCMLCVASVKFALCLVPGLWSPWRASDYHSLR